MQTITKYPEDITLFLDECRGIYIPCDFAKSLKREFIINREKWENDLDFLAKSGTEKDGYWDTWQDVLDGLKVKIGRRTYFFSQVVPGDVWMIRDTEKVRKDFFKSIE